MSHLKVTKRILGVSAAVIGALFISTAAFAQVEQPSEVSIQGVGLFTKSSEVGGVRQEATKSSGFLVGYTYRFNRWASAEGSYGFSRNTQNYIGSTETTGLQSNIHEITGTFVAHIPLSTRKVEPYALGGSGVLVFDPTSNNTFLGASRQSKAVFVYGGGVKFGLTNNIGIRTEYRGYVYKTPDFDITALSLDKVTHLAQPSAGIYFRF